MLSQIQQVWKSDTDIIPLAFRCGVPYLIAFVLRHIYAGAPSERIPDIFNTLMRSVASPCYAGAVRCSFWQGGACAIPRQALIVAVLIVRLKRLSLPVAPHPAVFSRRCFPFGSSQGALRFQGSRIVVRSLVDWIEKACSEDHVKFCTI